MALWKRATVKIKAILKQLKVLCFVSLFVTLLISAHMGTIPAQSNQSDEIVVTVKPVTPITPDVTPNEHKFETNYLLSRSYFNQFDGYLALNISEGIIFWISRGYSIRNVTIFDNLGNDFDPVVKNDTVLNPSAEVVLPPSFEYKIYLSLYTDQGIAFDSKNMEYSLDFDFQYPRQATLTVRFPNSFTILQCTPQVNQSQENHFIMLRWSIKRNELFDLFVRFLPFCIQGIVKSFKFTLDIPTAFPTKGFIKGTYEEVFETPATFSIWKINPLFAVPILFPGYAKYITVEKVWDGIGNCKEISEPVERLDNDSLGYYYVDNENREVIVYPRYHYRGGFYEYSVGATFVCPPEYKPFKMEAIKEHWLPFRYESYIIIDEILVPNNWKLEITGNVEVKFILPSGAQPLISESGGPTIGLEEDRPVARFVYNSPKTLSPSRWRVVYDLIPLRNFFWLEMISFVILLSILVVTIAFKLVRGARPWPSWLLRVFIPIGLALITPNVIFFYGLGGSKPFFIALFVGEVILFFLICLIIMASVALARA